MKMYRVVWEIDVEANSPEEAASDVQEQYFTPYHDWCFSVIEAEKTGLLASVVDEKFKATAVDLDQREVKE